MNDHCRILSLLEAVGPIQTVSVQKCARDICGLTSDRTMGLLRDIAAVGHARRLDRTWRVQPSHLIGPGPVGDYRILGGLDVDRMLDQAQPGCVSWSGAVRVVSQLPKRVLEKTLRHKAVILPLADFLQSARQASLPVSWDDLPVVPTADISHYRRFDHRGCGSFQDRWVDPDGVDGIYRRLANGFAHDDRPAWLWKQGAEFRIAESDQARVLCHHLAHEATSPVTIPYYHQRHLLMVPSLPRRVYQSLIAMGALREQSEPNATKPWCGFRLPTEQSGACLDLVRSMLNVVIEDL